MKSEFFWVATCALALSGCANLSTDVVGKAPVTALQNDAPPIPADDLHNLGFLRPGEGLIGNDGYVQLRVALYVPGSQTNVTMNACPEHGIWGIDLTNLTSGDKHVTFGAQVSLPQGGGAQPLNPVNLNPLDFSKTATGLFSSDCQLKVDAIRYVSPIYFVRKSNNQQFTISPTYEVTNALNSAIQDDLNALISATSALAGVPVATAAPYLSAIKTNLANAKPAASSDFIQHFVIKPGDVQEAFRWRVRGAIKETAAVPAQDLVLISQLLPVPTIVPAPGSGTPWTPGAVLTSAFNVPDQPAGTLGGYISSKYSETLINYANAANNDAADMACRAIAQAVNSIGLSDRDAALVLWAEAKQRAINGKATDGSVDNMPCLTNAWPLLKAAGIEQSPKDPPPVVKPADVPPTVAQMKSTTDINNALWLFFRSSSWTDQSLYAEQLFGFPLTYNDPNAAIQRQSGQLKDIDGILINEFDRDQPLLARVGCYAYFDINTDSTEFAKSQGAHSMMMAIGQIGQSGSAYANKEVALALTFGDSPGGDSPKIVQIDVLTALPASARQAMLTQLGKVRQCPSGYRPRMLFGNS